MPESLLRDDVLVRRAYAEFGPPATGSTVAAADLVAKYREWCRSLKWGECDITIHNVRIRTKNVSTRTQ